MKYCHLLPLLILHNENKLQRLVFQWNMSCNNINLKLQEQEFFLIHAVNKILYNNNILQGIVDLVTLDQNKDAGSELQDGALIVIIYYIKQYKIYKMK
jgi:hypothetical protein